MKTLERALDVHVGEWEYFAGESGLLGEARRTERDGGTRGGERADLPGPGKRETEYFPPFPLHLLLLLGAVWGFPGSSLGTDYPVSETQLLTVALFPFSMLSPAASLPS